jgi:hypothetical protein
LTASVTRPLTWLYGDFWSSGYSVRSGGSIPIVALFEKKLKSKTILMGFGLDSDAIHSNEHFESLITLKN